MAGLRVATKVPPPRVSVPAAAAAARAARNPLSSTMVGAVPPAIVAPPAAGPSESQQPQAPLQVAGAAGGIAVDNFEVAVQVSSFPPVPTDFFAEVDVDDGGAAVGAMALTGGSLAVGDMAVVDAQGEVPSAGISDLIEPVALPRWGSTASRLALAVAVIGCAVLGTAAYRYRVDGLQKVQMLDDARGVIERAVADLGEKNDEFLKADAERTELKHALAAETSRAAMLAEEVEQAQASVAAEAARNAAREKEAMLIGTLTERLAALIASGALKVVERENLMVIEISANTVFPAGRAYPTVGGRKVLKRVATALRVANLRRFVVAGHTDNVRVNNQNFKSNWELAAARSTSAMQVLSRNGLRARQLVVASYGQHDPVASNRTAEGRGRNSRLEITLAPSEIEPQKAVTPQRRWRGKRRR